MNRLPDAAWRYTHHPSPVGPLLLVGRGGRLAGLFVADHARSPLPAEAWVQDDDAFAHVRRQLDEYLAGDRQVFDVPLELIGTPFQRAVWARLLTIPYGQTASYGELAAHIGHPGASRAVGAANGRNPVSIIVPCHRVIGSDGSLAGYGWGPERKAWLLAHEGALLAASPVG